MRLLRVALCLALLALCAPATGQATGFGPAAPFQDTRPPTGPPPATSVGAFGINGKMRITRSFADGRPSLVTEVPESRETFPAVGHNAARDAVVAWAAKDPGQPGRWFVKTVIWPAGASAPTAPREVPLSETSGTTIFDSSAHLDAGGHSGAAVFQFTQDTLQVSSSDFAAADPTVSLITHAEPPQSGTSIDLDSTPDGRAVYAFKQRFAAVGATPAHFELFVSARVPGQPFSTAKHVYGGPPPNRQISFGEAQARLAPNGRAMIAFTTTNQFSSRACPYTSSDADRQQVHVALGAVSAPTDFTVTRVSAANRDGDEVQRPIVGVDDRLAVQFREVGGVPCDTTPDSHPQNPNFAYAVPGQGVQITGPPPEVFNAYWFQCDGQLYFKFTPPGGPAMGTVFDTGVPGTCGGDPGGGGGGGDPGGGDPGGGDPGAGAGLGPAPAADADGDGVPDATDPEPNNPAVPGPFGSTNANDALTGTAAGEEICGLLGNDVIDGLGGDDTLFGDLCGVQAKVVATGARAGAGGNDTLTGGAGNDTVFGAAGADKLFGSDGRDKLLGGDGADTLSGGDGKDALDGGKGNDSLTGGRDANSFKGGSGNDKVNARNGKKDRVDCGAGRKDRASVDRVDRVRGCEKVKRPRKRRG